jgi:hypothetical protein
MRVRLVSSLLFLQNFLPPISGGKGPKDSCSDGIQLCVSKITGRFRTALNSRFSTCTHEGSPFHPLSLRPQRTYHRIFRAWFSFLCQSLDSRPTSFTDVRVSGVVGRLSSDQKARQPSSLSRISLINWH